VIHCIAGGTAGILEHTSTFPMDTVKTHMQSYCAHCPNKDNCATTLRRIYCKSNGISGFYRGIQTMLYGCAPAHALYFSSYELTKRWFTASNPGADMNAMQGAFAGCISTFLHDSLMTPLDTLKQRMQLGHYNSVRNGLTSIVREEGAFALYRSFPITLATNLPYGSIMFAVNESLRQYLTENGASASIITYMIAGSGAGAVASALTTPLDRLKTKLQTQHLANVNPNYRSKRALFNTAHTKKGAIGSVMALHTNPLKTSTCNAAEAEILSVNLVKYGGVTDALRSILRDEGVFGLFRGVIPRICSHTPAVAISWTAYETAKKYLSSLENA